MTASMEASEKEESDGLWVTISSRDRSISVAGVVSQRCYLAEGDVDTGKKAGERGR